MKRFFLTVTAALLLVGSVAWAGALEEGVAAHQRGDYPVALVSFRALAEAGNSAAQFNLGQMYRLGQGIDRDLVEAAYWYHQAAAQGDGQSQYNLGVMYFNAQGVPRNFVFSHMWLTLSATAGVENAARNRTMLAKQMTKAQLAEALQLARDCKKREFKNCD
jgi:TPR repeat protein